MHAFPAANDGCDRKRLNRGVGLVAVMAIYAFMAYVSLNPAPPGRGGMYRKHFDLQGFRCLVA